MKTQLWKRLALELIKLHIKDPKMPQPFFVCNLLEESLEEFEDSLMAMIYYDKYEKDILANQPNKRRIDKMLLNSYKEDILTESELKDLKEIIEPIVSMILAKYFRINDDTYHPYGLYLFAKKASLEIGMHWYKHIKTGEKLDLITYQKIKDEKVKKLYKYYKFILNDDNIYMVNVTDHLELISPERDQSTGQMKSKWETMRSWSFDYGRKEMSKQWKCIMLNVLQMSAESQKKSYDYRNDLNWETLKPTLDSMSANKVIAQDHHIILGMFDAGKYSSTGEVDGIDLSKANNRYRSNTILKNRIGPANAEIQLYFDGATSTFYEVLDKATASEKDKSIFNHIVFKVKKKLLSFYELVKR